ncbi:MAG: hypothetical protein WB438_04230 [Candidatus Cybelea sp.]
MTCEVESCSNTFVPHASSEVTWEDLSPRQQRLHGKKKNQLDKITREWEQSNARFNAQRTGVLSGQFHDEAELDSVFTKRQRLIRTRTGHTEAKAMLSPSELKVFELIYDRAHGAGFKGKEIPLPDIEAAAGLSERQTEHILKTLEEKHRLIVRLPRMPTCPARYAVTLPETRTYHRELQEVQFENCAPFEPPCNGKWDWKAIRLRCGLPGSPDFAAMEAGARITGIDQDEHDKAHAFRLSEAEEFKRYPEEVLLRAHDTQDVGRLKYVRDLLERSRTGEWEEKRQRWFARKQAVHPAVHPAVPSCGPTAT